MRNITFSHSKKRPGDVERIDGEKRSRETKRRRFASAIGIGDLFRRGTPLTFLVACFCAWGVAPSVGWRKSPRCNMTTEFECRTGLRCIPVDQVCDRSPDCHDGSDEADCRCVETWLPPMHRCRNKKCVDDFYTCNGKDDCGDGGSDEENCACYGFRCTDGGCILSTWRCDGYKDCKDYSDEENCGTLLPGGRRHPFLGLIGPVGCLVAALAIRVLLRSHQRRRLLHSNGETAAAAAMAALEARNRRARYGDDAGVGDRFDDSLDGGSGGGGGGGSSNDGRQEPVHWMDRVGAGITSSFSQLRVFFSPNGQQQTSLPPPPPYTEAPSQLDFPPAYHRGTASTNNDIPSVFLLVIPAGKPPPTYNESMSLPDLVQSTANANQQNPVSPTSSSHEPNSTENSSDSNALSTISTVSVSAAAPYNASSFAPPLTSSNFYNQSSTTAATPTTTSFIVSAPYQPSYTHGNNDDDDDDDDDRALFSRADAAATTASTSEASSSASFSSPSTMRVRFESVTLRQNPLSGEEDNEPEDNRADGRALDFGIDGGRSTMIEESLTSPDEFPPAYEDVFAGSPTSSSGAASEAASIDSRVYARSEDNETHFPTSP